MLAAEHGELSVERTHSFEAQAHPRALDRLRPLVLHSTRDSAQRGEIEVTARREALPKIDRLG